MSDDEVGKLYPVAKAILEPLFRVSWRFDLQGVEHIPASGGAILCPNHTSVLDSFFVPALLPRRVTYVGKAEYMDSWKTRHLFPALGMIPIDREGGDAAERALSAAERVLRKGELFGIYPEGTRSRDGRLYRGHTGPARLALRADVPIIPIGIVGARDVMPPDATFPRLRLPVTIRFGEPIGVERYQDRAGDHRVLRQITDEIMYAIRELSGQEYVNEYATKKRAATEVAAASNGQGAGRNGSSGPGAPDAEAADAAATGAERPHGERAEEPESDFVAATNAGSSASVLGRPVRRSS